MTDEHRLRTALRDLVALSTIPAVWVGREPPSIAAGLADVLVGSLQLNFAIVRLCDSDGGSSVEATRGNGWERFQKWIDRRLAAPYPISRKEIIPDFGSGAHMCRGLVMPIGVNAAGGLVAVACDRADFPTETDQLLLSVAANQAATAFQTARLIHERRSAEAGLLRMNMELQRERENKLANLESVVAAIAHEVRQPLAAISSNAAVGRRFLERAPIDVDKIRGIFDQVERASLAASEVFENIRALFRNNSQEPQRIQINALVLEALQLLRKELCDRDISIRTELAPELPVVAGHKGQLQEVILNLVQNSIDAMAAMTERSRVIRVVTEHHGFDSIAISIEDTGPGIHPQKIASIFEPFVTTKSKGMGLGLAICKMIVERHYGNLTASSDVRSGARFQIILPLAAEPGSLPRTL